MTHRFADHRPDRGSDTAGVPWAGRTLTGTGFDDDTGEPDPDLVALLSEEDPSPADVVAAVAGARLVVPIVAVAGEVDESSGIPADASSDMASVTLVAPDGARALPAFTSTASLSRWDAGARPVPVTAQRAALAAVQEGCTVIPLDLPAPPGAAAYTLSGSMVWALAMRRTWVPAHLDEHVVSAVADGVREEPAVTEHALSGATGDLTVELSLRPGLRASEVQQILTRVGERLAADAETRARIDAVTFRITPA